MESVFGDRRSIDTTLIGKPLYEDKVYSTEDGLSLDMCACAGAPGGSSHTELHDQGHNCHTRAPGASCREGVRSTSCHPDSDTITKHFVKQTTIVPRTKSSIIPC